MVWLLDVFLIDNEQRNELYEELASRSILSWINSYIVSAEENIEALFFLKQYVKMGVNLWKTKRQNWEFNSGLREEGGRRAGCGV